MAMGGHVDSCDACGHIRVSYNSCRNRHCPKCQSTQRERWIINREQDLLPVSYFHVVFTLPEPLNQLCARYPVIMYNTLFHAAWETIQAFSTDPKHLGAEPGMISILHTWGQQLWFHPHLHCIVPGGGINRQGKWKQAKRDGKVTFTWKDYRDGEKRKLMTLQADEFLRRFCQHILPGGYVRIRHYGFLSCRKKPLLRGLQQQMGLTAEKKEKLPWQEICKLRLGFDIETCPCCGKGKMVTTQRWLPGRSPPMNIIALRESKKIEINE